MSKEQDPVSIISVPGSPVVDEVTSSSSLDPALRANPSPSKERSFFAWFDKNDGPVERRLILKLDFLILSFACMGFWVSRNHSSGCIVSRN